MQPSFDDNCASWGKVVGLKFAKTFKQLKVGSI